MFFVLARVFAKGPFDFGMNQLRKISALHPFLIVLGLTCAPTIFDWSTVLIEATAVTCIVTLEWAPMLLAEDTVLVGPAHFLGFLGNSGVNGLHLARPFSPFWLAWIGSLGIKIGVVLHVL